jgi:uncharacterized membrane protein YqjE
MTVQPSTPPDGDPDRDPGLGEAVQDVADKVTLLVREEIELAKTEVTEKVTSLVKGIVIGLAAAVFAFFGLFVLLEGFAWLAFWAIPFPADQIFWGFFIVAGLLFLLGGLAGYLAALHRLADAPGLLDGHVGLGRGARLDRPGGD